MSTELATTNHQVAPQDWGMIEKMGLVLQKSGFSTSTRTVEQAIVKIWFGREIGVSAMMSVQDIHIIEGKPSVGVSIMQAKLAGGGVNWEVEETPTACKITFHRKGWKPLTASFSEEEAKAAGLLGKDNWKKYGKAMRYARAFAQGARRIGADLLNGCLYTPDELGAETDEDGVPVKVTARVTKPAGTQQNAPESSQSDAIEAEAVPADPVANALSEAKRTAILEKFAGVLVGQDELEAKLGKTVDQWTEADRVVLLGFFSKAAAQYKKDQAALTGAQ